MIINCSLYNHPNAYRFSCKNALYAPLVSPYAVRHLFLAKAKDTSTIQRWGHFAIATIQFIPVIGLLASLIERIVCLAFKSLFVRARPQPEPRKEPPQTESPPIQAAPPPSIAEPAKIEDPYADLPPLEDEPVEPSAPAVAAPIQVVAPTPAQIAAAEELIEFCKHIPGGEAKVKYFSELPVFQQAEGLRKWIQQDAGIASLTELSIRSKGLRVIPPEISCFKELTELYLPNNILERLPEEIGSLVKLEKLLVYNNMLTSLPVSIGNLRNLKVLSLHGNALSGLPPEVGQLENLEQLSLYQNHSSMTVPDELRNLRKLKKIWVPDFNDNAGYRRYAILASLPSSCEKFKGIDPISSDNLCRLERGAAASAQAVTSGINSSVSVSAVSAPTSATVTSVLAPIASVQNSVSVSVVPAPAAAPVSTLPISVLAPIASIQTSEENVKILQDFCRHLPGGSVFILTLQMKSGGEAAAIRAWLSSNLASLTALDLKGAGLSVLPPEIQLLRNLETLDLDDNTLTKLPATIGNLSRLRTLNVRNNGLLSLPDEIGSLSALRNLRVTGNKIRVMPSIIHTLIANGCLPEMDAITQMSSLLPTAFNYTNNSLL